MGNIRFKGNRAISEDELRQVIATAPQTSFLGLGLFWWSQKPFNAEEFEKDLSLIRKLYTYKGFFFADVDAKVLPKRNGKKVDLDILIRENEPSRIDTLGYEGLEQIPPDLKASYLAKKALKINDVFSVERLIEERNRTTSFFRENGYAFFHEDSVRIKVDTVGTHAGVQFRLSMPERLKYGPVRAVVHNARKRDDAVQDKPFAQRGITGTIAANEKINPTLIASAIKFQEGTMTRQSLEQKTLQNLGGTGIFSSIYINPDSVRAGELYTTVHLETAPKHQIEPKALVDNRYGALFFGGSLAYENKNLFGGAEQFRTSTEYGTQATASSRLLGSLTPDQYDKVVPYQVRLKNSLILPVLTKPGNYFSATAEYSKTLQPVLLSTQTGLVRGSYSAKLSSASRLNFDFFEFEWVKNDSLRGFKQLFRKDLAKNIGIDPSKDAAVNAGLDSLLNTHINQTLRLRYNYTNRQNVQTDKTILNLDLLAEESGSLAWLIDRYLDTGSYRGFSNNDAQIFGVAYSQYVKLESEMGFTRNISPRSQFAGRAMLGWMRPYGKAETTPEERRFYAGGANSMRGWLFNTLGPGNSKSAAAANFGADIKLEMGLEYRRKFFKFLNQPSGIALFSDIGNIWDRTGPYAFSPASLVRDFAWDAGVGLRLGSPIGPFRFDFAYKLHDPTSVDPWRISHFNLRDFTFNFGIGEAF
ncbi:MAG: BamA/TamA family outer membrane protein [Chlorobiaceae bacterium]